MLWSEKRYPPYNLTTFFNEELLFLAPFRGNICETEFLVQIGVFTDKPELVAPHCKILSNRSVESIVCENTEVNKLAISLHLQLYGKDDFVNINSRILSENFFLNKYLWIFTVFIIFIIVRKLLHVVGIIKR